MAKLLKILFFNKVASDSSRNPAFHSPCFSQRLSAWSRASPARFLSFSTFSLSIFHVLPLQRAEAEAALQGVRGADLEAFSCPCYSCHGPSTHPPLQ